MRYAVLGGSGAMGRIAVRDLFESSRNNEIIIAGNEYNEVKKIAASFKSKRVKAAFADVKNIDATAKLLRNADVCVNAVIYYYNLHVMKACLKAKVSYVDLGGLFHMTRRQLKLHKQFADKGLLAILGCGSTPGITNVLIRYASPMFDKLDDISIRFGSRSWTKYKQHFVIPYTAYTLFDEFTDKPAVYSSGKLGFAKPMSGKDTYKFPKPVGKQRCFYTLHSELATIPSNYREKGLKNCSFRVCFPEDFVRDVNLLIELGFASKKKIKVNGKEVVMRDIAAKELNRMALPKDIKPKDIEFILVDINGEKNGKKKAISIYAAAKSNPRWKASAGDIDTGVPLSIMAQMIANGKAKAKGVLAPEQCVEPKLFFRELKKRNIKVFVHNKAVENG